MPRQFGVPEELISDITAERQLPSAYSPFLSALYDKHVIGINNAYMLGDWLDVVFFGDYAWYLPHRTELAKWPKLKVSCATKFGGDMPYEGVKYLEKDKKKAFGISTDPTTVCWNNNSGAAAISLANHFGAKRILLLGFDMSLDSNNISHWHGSHTTAKRHKPDLKRRLSSFNRHLRSFPDIARDAKFLKIEILNISPNSAIEQFRKVELKEVL